MEASSTSLCVADHGTMEPSFRAHIQDKSAREPFWVTANSGQMSRKRGLRPLDHTTLTGHVARAVVAAPPSFSLYIQYNEPIRLRPREERQERA